MRGNSATHTFVIGGGWPAFAKTQQDVSKIGRPPDEERAHEPVTELENVIDSKAVLGSVGRLAEKLVDHRQAKHIDPGLPPRVLDAAQAACARAARDEN